MNRYKSGILSVALISLLTVLMVTGCGKKTEEISQDNNSQKEAAAGEKGELTEYTGKNGWKTKYDPALIDVTETGNDVTFSFKSPGTGKDEVTISYSEGKLPSEVLYDATSDVETGDDPQRIQRVEGYFDPDRKDWCYGRYIPSKEGGVEPERAYTGVEHNGGTLLISEISLPMNDVAAQSKCEKAIRDIHTNFEWTDHKPQQEFDYIPGTYERRYKEEMEGEFVDITDTIVMNPDHTGKLSFQDDIDFIWTSFEFVENDSDRRYEYKVEGDTLYVDCNMDGNSLAFERKQENAPAETKKPFEPSEIHDLVSAEAYGEFEKVVIDAPESLKWLEEHFGTATKLDGWPNCPYDMMVVLKRKDGAVFEVQPATDSCDNLKAGDVWYKYNAENTKKLFEIFDLENKGGKILPKANDILPKYTYEGNDGIEKAVTEYFLSNNPYEQNEYITAIPNFVLLKYEDAGNDIVKVYGNFALHNFSKRNKSLFLESGGTNPGVLYLKKTGDNKYEPLKFDPVELDSGEEKEIRRVCGGNKELEEKYYTAIKYDSELFNSCRHYYLNKYVKACCPGVDSVQEFGRDPEKIKAVEKYPVELKK